MNERVKLYSASLYEAAVEANVQKEVYESLISARDVIEKNKEYIKIVSSANLTEIEREGLIEEAFWGRVHVFVLNFMKLLAKKRIFEIFVPSSYEFEKQYMKDNNIVNAKIITAYELCEEKKNEVTEKIGKATEKKVVPEFVVNENIIGGIIIETDNTSIDSSVTGKLDALRRHMAKIN